MMRDVQSDPRNLLLDLFRQGLAAVNGRSVVHAWLQAHPPQREFHLVALGKAADAMTAGALDAAAQLLRAGLVVTRYGFLVVLLELPTGPMRPLTKAEDAWNRSTVGPAGV